MKLIFLLAFSTLAFGQYSARSYCADAGSTDAYACSFNLSPVSYVAGNVYRFKANTANTGTASINFNSLGAKTIVIAAGGVTTTLSDNAIRPGQMVDLVYDGTNMQMQSTSGLAPQAAGLSLLIANNLSDVNSQTTALTNLLGSSKIPIVNGGAVAQGSNICGTASLCAAGNLTQAQIVSLTSTGSSYITIISAPAAGSQIVIDSAVFQGAYNSIAAYAGGSNINLYYGTANTAVSAVAIGTLTNTFKTTSTVIPVALANTTATYVALPITIGISGSSFTCASTCTPLYYWVKYHIITGLQ